MSDGVIEVLPSKGGGYFWHLKAANGEITASSGSESFEHPTDAKSAAMRVLGEDITVRIFPRGDKDDDSPAAA